MINDVRIYKVFHPRPMIYAFNRSGLMHFASATEYDRRNGEYASNRNPVIRKCDALYLGGHREPAREVHFFADARTSHLSISEETFLRIVNQHILTTPDHSFETPKDLRLYFDEYTNSMNDAERLFGEYVDQLATRFPEKVTRHQRK